MGTISRPEILAVTVIGAIYVALLIWVARDARKRGMVPLLWVGIVLVFHLLGLVAYFIARQPRQAPATDRPGAASGADFPTA